MIIERRLLYSWERIARRHGVPSRSIIHWVRRKMGNQISIWRQTEGKNNACTYPCVLCKETLLRYDIKVFCYTPEGKIFSGKLNERNAPLSVLTSSQRRLFNPH